jgi:hypothetical protein
MCEVKVVSIGITFVTHFIKFDQFVERGSQMA